MLPFVVEMETLLLAALFKPLNERLFISQLTVVQVWHISDCTRLVPGKLTVVSGTALEINEAVMLACTRNALSSEFVIICPQTINLSSIFLKNAHIVLQCLQVNQTVGEVESVNVTMSGVFSVPSLAVAEVSPNDKQCCPCYAIEAIALCMSCCNRLYFFPESQYKRVKGTSQKFLFRYRF